MLNLLKIEWQAAWGGSAIFHIHNVIKCFLP